MNHHNRRSWSSINPTYYTPPEPLPPDEADEVAEHHERERQARLEQQIDRYDEEHNRHQF